MSLLLSPDDFEKYHHQLRTLLVERSYQKRDVTLASGQKSDFYFDCKQTSLSAEGHFLIGQLFAHQLASIEAETNEKHIACAGMSIGADPLCSSLSLTGFLKDRILDSIFVRKEAKSHGTAAFLEGIERIPKSSPVILLEDVITTGGSTLLAFERVKEGGFQVKHVLALVDRGAGGAENLQKAGLQFWPLFHVDDFR
jgi:orotate phosphoribosyltransferase